MAPVARPLATKPSVLGSWLGWTVKYVTLAAVLLVPALLVLQVLSWVGGYGGAPLTLTAIGQFADVAWHVPPPWGALPLLVPLIAVPMSLHVLAWLLSAKR